MLTFENICIAIVVGVLLGCLWAVGCVLAQSQQDSEIGSIIGYKLTVRLKTYSSVRKWHEYTLFEGSLDECQEHLNSHIWPNVISASVWHEDTKTRWKADHNGVLVRVPPETKVAA